MCGITGIYDAHNRIDKQNLVKMTDEIIHRGPDDCGHYFNEQIGLGHRRLSIIDLSKNGHQPMSNEDGNVWIVYNGEIYNYIELRDELKKRGHIFKSKTDTEVIIHAYEEWKYDCLGRFNGMFAFAIWNENEKELFCARDRFGIKPFYYYLDELKFVFASEIKSILKEGNIQRKINNERLYDFLNYGLMDHTSETLFKDIVQLKPAHALILKKGKVKTFKYWDLNNGHNYYLDFKDHSKSSRVLQQEFYDLFFDSVKLRLRSDVPIGVLLSGGIDSSSIVGMINKIQSTDFNLNKLETYSAGFMGEKADERIFINKVINSFNVKNNFIFPSGDEFLDTVSEIIYNHDEPIMGTSIYAHWHLMKEAKKNRTVVLLHGQGADEILCGYHRYFYYYFADLMRNFMLKRCAVEMNDFTRTHNYNKISVVLSSLSHLLPIKFILSIKNIYRGHQKFFSEDFLDASLNDDRYDYKSHKYLSSKLYSDIFSTHLPYILHYEDRNSMAFSIESRVPFLDHRLVEFAFSLPIEQRLHNGISKPILRHAMTGIIPKEIINRKDKVGFSTPMDQWLTNDAKDSIVEILNSQKFNSRNIFNVNNIKNEYDEYCNGKVLNKRILWRIISTEIWLRKYFD